MSRLTLITAIILGQSAGALVSTTITVDGTIDDWAGVLADASNAVADPSGDALDLDHDMTQGAATWDNTNLYLLFRRASASGNKAWRTTAYIDVDGDGFMEATDRIVWYRFLGNGSYTGGGVFRYVPADTVNGDLLLGDGTLPPGTQGTAVAGAVYSAARDTNRINIEARADWTSLGVPSGSPINVKFAIGPQNGAPTDGTDVLSLRYRALTLVEPQATAASAGATITISHTLTNAGNGTEDFDLTTTSALGWNVVVRDSVAATSSVRLARGASITLYLDVGVPPTAADGQRDTIVLRATCAADPAVNASVTDRVSVGQLLVIPDGAGSMAAGSAILYRTTITNNSSLTRSVTASPTSSAGWQTAVFEADGTTPLPPSFTLGPNGTRSVVVSVSVPAAATTGMQDLTTLRAVLETDTAVRGQGLYTTTVRPAVQLEPDADNFAGPNTYSFFNQTVRNSWPATRTVNLTAYSPSGWQVAYYAADGVTPMTSVTLGPNGGSVTVKLRVRIPAGAIVGSTEAITSTATAGVHSDSCTSRVTVVRLATYSDAGFTQTADTFVLGSTVYARVMGFTAGQTATFTWRDHLGGTSTDVRTTDALGTTFSSLPLGAASVIGTWTVEVNVGGTPVGPIPFTVRYYADLTALSATDADPAGTPITITSTARNRAAIGTIPDTAVRYLVWWDANGNSIFDGGDTWADSGGSGNPYSAPGGQYTHETTVPALAPGTSWTDPGWSLASDNLPYAGSWHVTASWVLPDGNLVDQLDTTCLVRLSTLSLSVGVATYSFGAVNPGQTYDSGPIPIIVLAGEAYDLTKTTSGMVTQMGLTTELEDQLAQAAGPKTFVDRFLINIPWTTDPGPVNATVTYTIVAR